MQVKLRCYLFRGGEIYVAKTIAAGGALGLKRYPATYGYANRLSSLVWLVMLLPLFRQLITRFARLLNETQCTWSRASHFETTPIEQYL